MKKNSAISVLGAGGHAKVVVSTLLDIGCSVDSIYDDDRLKKEHTILNTKIKTPLSGILERKCSRSVIAIGDNKLRRKISEEFKMIEWITAIHSTAYVSKDVEIGCGTVVFAGAIIQAGTVIGKHCIINTGAIIDHDCIIEDYSHIGPGSKLAGNVKIGKSCFLGVGSVVVPNVAIGSNTVVGAGGVVVNDLPKSIIACGVPARNMKQKK